MQAPKIENPKFFQILKKAQIIPEDFIDDLLEELEGNALDVLATLIQSGAGSKRQLCQIWCDSIGIAHVDLEKSLFQPHVVRKIPERSARLLYAIPVYQMGDTITVATATPDNETIKKEITRIVEGPINLVFALPQDIEWAIENAYQTNTTLYEFFKKIKTSKAFEADDPITEKNLTEIAGPEAVNQLHVCLILFGITENTSEIQIEPEKDFATIHFIVDQKVQKQIKLQTSVYRSLVSSLKRLAKLEADEKSEPQYARILFPTPRKKIDIRFLSLPHDHGEKIFLKLMDRSPHKCVFDLSGLYLSHKNLDALRRLINPLSGLLLVTGPLGSGKTTLAYSILRELRGSNVRMMSVEDSIRFLLKGIDQYQVNPQADCTKTAVTEACLKLHPKVLYIQNLEDTEITQSLRQGIESEKLLVLAGMQAADVFEALEKAARVGLAPYVSGILNQETVPRLCDHCREPYVLSPRKTESLFNWDGKTPVTAFRESGCPYCRHIGFFGRIGVQELLVVNEALRNAINNQMPEEEIKDLAHRSGFKAKHYDGIKKALRGLTTLNDIEKMGAVQTGAPETR